MQNLGANRVYYGELENNQFPFPLSSSLSRLSSKNFATVVT